MPLKTIDFWVLHQNSSKNLSQMENLLNEIKLRFEEKNILIVDFLMNDQNFTFFSNSEHSSKSFSIEQEAPLVNMTRCKRCGACVNTCKEEAIILNRQNDKLLILPEKCIKCGKCIFACNKNAIFFKKYNVALVELSQISLNVYYAQCFYKNLYTQYKKIILNLLKSMGWKSENTKLIVILFEKEFTENLIHAFSSEHINVKTI